MSTLKPQARVKMEKNISTGRLYFLTINCGSKLVFGCKRVVHGCKRVMVQVNGTAIKNRRILHLFHWLVVETREGAKQSIIK